MSDTPKTNVVKDRYSMVVEACEEYRAQLDLYRSKIENLERENTALREDKERLDSGEIMLMVSDEKMRHVGRHKIDLRAAIDAAREAQP